MRYLNETVLLAAAFCLAAVSVCWAEGDDVLSGRELLRAMRRGDRRSEKPARGDKTAPRTPQKNRRKGDGDRPSAIELLDKYAETQAKLQSFIIKSRNQCENEARHGGQKPSRYRWLDVCEFRFDGERSCLRYHRDMGKDHTYTSGTYDGHSFVSYLLRVPFPANCRCHVPKGAHDAIRRHHGCQVMGYFYGDNWEDGNRIDSVLRRATRISVRDRMEPVGASKCYVIDAESPRGRYTVWMDPEHGYNIAKAEVFRGRKQCDIVYDEDYRKMPRPEGLKAKSLFDSVQVVRFKRIEGVWVPMEAHTEMKGEERGAFFHVKVHHKRTEVILDPDHDALRSFYPDDIPSGTKIRVPGEWLGESVDRDGLTVEDDFYFTFIWKPGAKFVMNEKGLPVRNDPNRYRSPIIKTIQFGSILNHFKPEPLICAPKVNKMLVCFWDINEEQSQQLLLSLRDRQAALAKKGAAIIGVEASGANKEDVRSWAKENKLNFPVGTSYGLYEWFMRKQGPKDDAKPVLSHVASDLRMAWRIEKLPWLILTHREHGVTAEDFGLKELDDILLDEVLFEKPTSKPPSLSEPTEVIKTASKLLPDGLQEDLILYYSFDKDEGEKVTDASGNGNHGRVYGAKHTRERGGAMEFDGWDGYISVGDIELKEYSFSVRVKPSISFVNDRYIFVLGWVHCHALWGNSSRSLGIVADGRATNERDYPFKVNAWAHLVLTHQSGTFKLYKDGKLIKTAQMESSPVTDTLYLGGKERNWGNSWAGTIDEVALFDRALTEEEVKLLCNNSRKNK